MKTFPRLIGVIHLPPLARAPEAGDQDPAEIVRTAGQLACREAELMKKNRFDGLIIENFGDVPFYKDRVPAETIASMTVIAHEVRRSCDLSLGINVLRNDWRAALAIASCTGSDFIRVNVLSGVVATDQGLIEGEAAQLCRTRAALRSKVRVLADAQVKHAKSLTSDDLELEIEELLLRAGADGVIVTGSTTGRPVDAEKLQLAGRSTKKLQAPLFVGSGATSDSLAEILSHATGVIVGSAIREGGKAGAPLDPSRVASFAKSFYSVAP